MKKIKLTQGKVALVDDEDFERLNKYKWNAHKERNTFYARRNIRLEDGRRITCRMHREILGLTNSKVIVDHRNGNGLNNRRKNLRTCTYQQNGRSSGKFVIGSSKYKGVYFDKRYKKWTAKISIEGAHRQKHLGSFDNERGAAVAYIKAAKQHFGEFARA